jgi:hypothetical protein
MTPRGSILRSSSTEGGGSSFSDCFEWCGAGFRNQLHTMTASRTALKRLASSSVTSTLSFTVNE